MSSGLYLKKLAKMLEISSFFVFQGNSVFLMIEQAEQNRAFFARYGKPSRAELFGRYGEPSRAELFFPKAWAKTEPSQAELWLGPNTTTKLGDEKFQALFCLWRVMGNIGVGGIS